MLRMRIQFSKVIKTEATYMHVFQLFLRINIIIAINFSEVCVACKHGYPHILTLNSRSYTYMYLLAINNVHALTLRMQILKCNLSTYTYCGHGKINGKMLDSEWCTQP